MAFALRVGLLLAATVRVAHSGRVADLDLLLEAADSNKDGANQSSLSMMESAANGFDKDVDFEFMTTDFRYPGHEASFFGTVKEWFGGRSTSDDTKEEIVQGHFCQKRGDREQTYYATSLCYWLPEISSRRSRQPILAWKGGKYTNGKSLCGGLSGSGVCAKCSVCHNNARDEEGDIEREVFTEQLKLPDGCLGEKQIERQCVYQFDESSQELKVEDTRCHEVEGRWDHATQELAKCTSALQRLPQKIQHDLPAEMQRAQRDISRKEGNLEQARYNEQNQRQRMQGECNRYSSLKSGLRWQNMFLGATPTEQLLDMMSFHCSYPRRPIDNNDGRHWDEMARFNNQMELYNACNRCDNAKSQLRSANSRKSSAQTALTQAERKITRLNDEMVKAQQELQMWRGRQPRLAMAKQTMDNEWMPQASGCKATYSEYQNGKANHVSKCAPTFYDSSCEKACVEVQARHAGCGVMEGDSPGSINGKGGIEATCAPPQPSWVLGPFTYGAKEAEGGQCSRIAKAQMPQHAQKILKSGWLWKKGRGLNGWDKRFFVLESSDQVRSAVLRYFKKDPSTSPDSDESVGKGIILWDAKGLKAKTGAHYGWKHGEECFKLYHFYRDFRLCVPGEEGKKVTGKSQFDPQIEKDRDEWMDLLSDELTHSEK